MSDFVERLAKRWCPETDKTRMIADGVCREKIAAATREALAEAENIAKQHFDHLGVDHAPPRPLKQMLILGGRGCAEEVAAAIAALRESKKE